MASKIRSRSISEAIENSVIGWNYLYLTHKLTKAGTDEKAELLKALKEGSIITWRHVNFYGEYDFSEEILKDSIGFNLPEIIDWNMEVKREQIIPLKPVKTKDYQNSYETFLPVGDFLPILDLLVKLHRASNFPD